jgi:hypothetical protein
MPFKKFEQNDVFYNSIKTFPHYEFKLHDGNCYINGSEQFVKLNDLNLGSNYYPFIPKGGYVESFKTATAASFSTTQYGSLVSGSYPLTSSIDVSYFPLNDNDRAYIYSLKNTLNRYSINSPHYLFSSSLGDKAKQTISLISIPSIFFGSSIEKGSVSLEFYFSGSLCGKLEDIKKNGELVQTTGSYGNGNVAGVVLYNEGFILLTGSWEINDSISDFYIYNKDGSSEGDHPKWMYWGTGFKTVHALSPYSSFQLKLNGVNYVQTLTMFAHANKGELNHSNNPTYVKYGEAEQNKTLSSFTNYTEPNNLEIKNTVKYKYENVSGSFEKQTYISKIGIYDKNKNLIAIAKISKPVKKTENRNFTFKLKLDI